MNLVQKFCEAYCIKFDDNAEGLSDFDKELNKDIPDLFTVNAATFIVLCAAVDVKISEVRIVFGGYQFFFQDAKGDAIIHKFSFDKDQGRLETMGFDFDDGDVQTHTPWDLALLIKAEIQGNQGFSEV